VVGIISFGIYIPQYRMNRKTIFTAMGWLNPVGVPGEKAIANSDEDSLTMAVAAGMKCLGPFDQNKVDGLYFATTTSPYKERESASIIAAALDLRSSIRTSDFTNSLKAGTGALLSSCESVQSKGARNALICASDCRLGKPGSAQEYAFGDGAAAFLIGSEEVVASLEGFFSVSYDFPDHWRSEFDKFDRTSEERWIRDEGYNQFIPEAILGLFKKYGLESKAVSKLIYPCIHPREHSQLGKRLGFKPEQIQEPLYPKIGECGTATSLMMLAAALEEAKPGDHLLAVSYGNGSEALWFTVTEEIKTKSIETGIKEYFKSGRELTSYEKYLAFRGILPVETGLRGEVGPTQLVQAWRERKAILALYGSKCNRCGTPQYPPQRICVNPNCSAIDEMEPYRFSNKKGKLFSFTEDHLAFSLSAPQMYGLIDFEGGGRFNFDITDCESGSLKVGMPMKMTFRRKYVDEARGIYGYFWKIMPVRE